MSQRLAWKVSLHGGHSSQFCDHASSTLDEMLRAAAAFGYAAFGVSEHAPRSENRFLYPEERSLGWDATKLASDFEAFTVAINAAASTHRDGMEVLRGFEAEVVPSAGYAPIMNRLRRSRLSDGNPAFDYMVGSVHHVGELQIDGPAADFMAAIEATGGPEALAIAYYAQVAEMLDTLKPDVAAHLDLIRKRGEPMFPDTNWRSPRIRAAAERALEAVLSCGAIIDVNTAGWRKGLDTPYPEPWLVHRAAAMGCVFCFGDDSHCAADVGAGVERARHYLLGCGVTTITTLRRAGSGTERAAASLV
ncbi:MAG: histidinol-phosphatase HisJ family protein [Armatimonadetes bacterium]|nr:histidinol-phosphatase HisJ family protein [Armatimonadota bacterium]MDE2205293.1 histidinol-phosphatase HisJ family protein [Armatimonadota bacterium]